MTTPNLESAQNQGAQETPNPAASGGAGGSPTSNVSDDVLLARLEQKMESRLQSMTDKRMKQTDNQLSDIQSVVGKLKPYLDKDMTLEEASRQAQIDDLLAGKLSQSTPATVPAVQPQVADAIGGLVAELELDLNDPQIKQAVMDANGNVAKLSKGLIALQVSRATAPTPNSATNASPSGGTPQASLSDSEVEVKSAELDLLYRNPTINAAKISTLEKELNEVWKK